MRLSLVKFFITLIGSVWARIDEPRAHRLLVGVKYVFSFLLGIEFLRLSQTPGLTLDVLWFSLGTGVFLCAGALLGVAFAWTKRWIWERPATMLVILGALQAIYVSMYEVIAHQALLGGATAILSCMFVISMIDRYLEIVSDDYEITPEDVDTATRLSITQQE